LKDEIQIVKGIPMSVAVAQVLHTIFASVAVVAILGLLAGVVIAIVSKRRRNTRLLDRSKMLMLLNMALICQCLIVFTVIDPHRHTRVGFVWLGLAAFCLFQSIGNLGRIWVKQREAP
jgi:hypothetical protein